MPPSVLIFKTTFNREFVENEGVATSRRKKDEGKEQEEEKAGEKEETVAKMSSTQSLMGDSSELGAEEQRHLPCADTKACLPQTPSSK